MNRSNKLVFNRRLGISQGVSERLKASRKGASLNKIAGSFVFLTWCSAPALSWADICVGASTTINSSLTTSTGNRCDLDAGESLIVDATGVVTHTGANLPVFLRANAGDVTIRGQVTNQTDPYAVAILANDLTQSEITNYGVISANGDTVATTQLSVPTSLKKINNQSGALIESFNTQAIFNGGQITDGIRNAGTIKGVWAGIFNSASPSVGFTRTIGNIINTSTGTITATGAGSAGIDNGALIQGISNEGTISGVLAGIRNTGTITQDTNGYAIDNRTGTITNGILNSGTLDGNIALNAAALTLNGNDGRVTGDITGNGGSTITVNGAFKAEANASVDHIVVNNNASLSFTTSQTWSGSSAFANSGTVTIGTPASPGVTLTTNDYTQSIGGVLKLAVTNASAGGYSKLVATGTATFNSDAAINVDVNTASTLAKGNLLAGVVTAQTLNASTFTVTDNSALFNFQAILNGNAVDLRVTSASATGTGVRDAITEGRHWSALGAASVLDAQVNNGTTGDMGKVVTALGQLTNNRDVARATAQTLPVISGNQAVQGALSTFQNLVQNRTTSGATGLSGGDAFANKNAWGKVFGSRAEQDNRSGAAGFTADTWGLALGADAKVASEARFGVAYGYAKTSVNGNTDLSGAAQRANIDSHVISAYGSKDIGGNRTFSFQGDIGLNDSKSTRDIEFGGLNRTARADYRTYSAHVGAALAQAFELSEKTTLTPALRADYTWLKSQAYSESGADALNLNVGSNKTDAFVIGADAYLQHRFSNTSRFDANFGVGYDTINKQGSIVAAYAGAPGQSFLTTGIDHSPWLVRGGIGYSMLAANGTEVSFRYDAEGRSDYLNHTASVKAKWAF